jgi:hypothetical protein
LATIMRSCARALIGRARCNFAIIIRRAHVIFNGYYCLPPDSSNLLIAGGKAILLGF